MLLFFFCLCYFFFKQKTANEMRISEWSSDVCSSDLTLDFGERVEGAATLAAGFIDLDALFAVPGAERPSPAMVLYEFADEVLTQAAALGNGTLTLDRKSVV